VPIPGTTKLHRLEENLGAASVELTREGLDRIDQALAQVEVQGDRYPAHPEEPGRPIRLRCRRREEREMQ
jgi:diketogulonate reductase-like aldo/keto reductase